MIKQHGTTTSYRNGCRCQPCRDAIAEYGRQYRSTPNGGYIHQRVCKRSNLKRIGLSLEQYDLMVASQNNLCAACGSPEKHNTNGFGHKTLAIDHDHITGEVRGLLCMNCNRALGFLEDSIERCNLLLKYRRGFR